jgi:hypothetical protein
MEKFLVFFILNQKKEILRLLEKWNLEKPAEKDGWKAIGDYCFLL